MKIIATIADDRIPEGWRETFKYPGETFTEEEARSYCEDMVAKFNGHLRAGELPRRLLSVSVAEFSAKEAWELGNAAYWADEWPCPFEHESRQWSEWHRGHHAAQQSEGDGDETSDDEDDDDEHPLLRAFCG